MELPEMILLTFVWPLAVGWYGSERGLKLGEAIVLGLLPIALVLAITL